MADRQGDVQIVDHQIEDNADVGRAECVTPGPRRFDQPRILHQRPHAGQRRIELLDVPDLQHGAVPVSGPDEFLRLSHVDRQWLLDEQVNAMPQQIHADRMVQTGGGRDDGGVDLADHIAIVGDGRNLCLGGSEPARFHRWIGHGDEFGAFDVLEQAGVNSAQMPTADHGQLDGLHAALLRSRARPCFPSCCS